MRYRVTSDNRLRIAIPRRILSPHGCFSTDRHNNLVYWLNEPAAWRREFDLPQKITLSGRWKLDAAHNLHLELDEKTSRQRGQLVLRGQILCAEADKLIFAIKSGQGAQQSSVRLLQLRGHWGSDAANRLCFYVSRTKKPDTLTFQGAWQVNANQQIEYRYVRTDLARQDTREHCLEFSGYWRIHSARRISYILNASSHSQFDFKVFLETPTLYPSGNMIKYRIGIGAARSEDRQRLIALLGTWKFDRRAGVTFEIHYGRARVQACMFGAQIALSRRDSLEFQLKNKQGQDTGMRLVLTRRFLKQLDAQMFLRLEAARREKRAEAGLTIPF